ncbi:Uncharacterized protein APZ42_034033 [Daphnia magna]|uniref:Uncharacterized protein n=1 Tax=Daphnia magna TaxID=35525 RepID=A0A164KI86_9CRUS|nr:Uncharacterized protein APZ42_034033 [Daphnia magna]
MGKMIILKYLITPDMCCIRCPYPRLCRQKASINISNGPSREHLMVMKALQQVLEIDNFDGLLLKCVTEFQAFEKKLLSELKTFDAVVLLVKRCGGDTVAETVSRAWDRITTKECRSACNWCIRIKGYVKKHKIAGFKIVTAVQEGVRKTLPDANDSQLGKRNKKNVFYGLQKN